MISLLNSIFAGAELNALLMLYIYFSHCTLVSGIHGVLTNYTGTSPETL